MLSALTRASRFIPQPATIFWSVSAYVLLPWIIACKMETLLMWIINPYGRSGDLLSGRRRAMPILASESCTFSSDSWFPRGSWQNSDRKTTVFVIAKGYHYAACQENEKMQNEQEIQSAGHFRLFSLYSTFTCQEPHRWYNETLSNYSSATNWGHGSETALIAKITSRGKSLANTCRSAPSSSVNTKRPQGYHVSWSGSLTIA